ncbi:Gamma-interferon-responsive lysosomal thiol protein [Linum perenne]
MATLPQLTSAVCLLLLLSSFSFAASSSELPRAADSSGGSNKVSLALYYETLCPYCANFIVNYLVRVFEDDELFSIVDLYLSPWGNAKIRSNETFVCQHGPVECLLNTVEACAIHAWPKLEKHFPFIYCVEKVVSEGKPAEWESCFRELALDQQPILDCFGSGYGKQLELNYAAETSALTPPHQYVPWVVVDGQPLYEDYENFISYICKAYKGTANPKACSKASVIRNQKPTATSSAPVSYKDDYVKTSRLSNIVRSAVSTWIHAMDGAM